MKFNAFSNQMLCLHNELALAHRNSTADTWPAMRDEVLKRHDMLEELGELAF